MKYTPLFSGCHSLAFLILHGLLLISSLAQAGDQKTIINSHAIAMHGDTKYPENFQHFAYASPQAVKGGTLKLGIQGSFDSLNPFIAKGTAADKINWLYDTLTVGAGDEAFSRYGLIAERIEYPADRSWVIYHLRPQARFHDGQAITAEDVVFSFNLLITKGSPVYRSYYGQVESVTALSPHRVKFDFGDHVNHELALIVGELPIFPKHYWQQHDFSKSSLEIPLGSGPYKIITVDAGRKITYQRVEDYWAKDLPVNVGLYNFDRIQLDYYKDAVVLLEALKAGQLDIRLENFSKQWATGYTGTAIEKGWLITEEIAHQNPTGMQGFVMNLRRSLFQDRRVRQALGYAFDFEWTNKTLFYGAYTRTDSFFSNSELASSGMLAGEELELLQPYRDQLPRELFDNPFKLPVSDANGYNRKNLRIAVSLLKEAGWQVIDNQLVHAETGQPFIFEIMLVQPSFERIVNPYSKSLKKLGIKVNVRHVEISQYINRMRRFDFDMIVGGAGQSLSPGNEQMDYWHSSAADTTGSRNYSGLKNSVVDRLVESIVTAPDRQQLIYRTRALDRVLLNDYIMIPQWHIGSHRLAYWNKFSRPEISPKYDPGFNLGILTWWLDPVKNQQLQQAQAAE